MIRLLTMVVFALLGSAVSAQEKYPNIKIKTDAEHIARHGSQWAVKK